MGTERHMTADPHNETVGNALNFRNNINTRIKKTILPIENFRKP